MKHIKKLLVKHFNNLKVIKFPKNKKIRHQFAVPAGNVEFDVLCTSVIEFIEEFISELNESIGDMLDIDITIADNHLFGEEYSYNDIKQEMDEQLVKFKMN